MRSLRFAIVVYVVALVSTGTAAAQMADLVLTKDVDDATPNVADQVTYTITLSNAGPDTANNIEVTDNLPGGVNYVFDNPSAGTYDAVTGIWSVSSLANGASEALEIVVNVDASGTITNTATVTASDEFDPDTGNDSASVDIVVPPAADLGVTKVVDNGTPNVGDQVTYMITLINNGPDTANNIEVTDILPVEVSYVSDISSPGIYDSITGVWTVGALTHGASAALQITVTVNASGTITNTAYITASDEFDPDPANNTAWVDIVVPPAADLDLTKTVDNPTPYEADFIVYTITLTNNGPSEATNIEVSDLLPAGVTFDSDNPSQGWYDFSTGVWYANNLPNGASATLEITVFVDGGTAGQTISNTATITAVDQLDPNPGDETDTVDITVLDVIVAWNTDLDGNWCNAANWNPMRVPRWWDEVVIDRPAASPVVSVDSCDAEAQDLTNHETIALAPDTTLTSSTIAQDPDGVLTAGGASGWAAVFFDSFVNQGTISATQLDRNLELWTLTGPTPAGLTNTGLLVASNGGDVVLRGVAYTGSGSIRADGSGSEMLLEDVQRGDGGGPQTMSDAVTTVNIGGPVEAANFGRVNVYYPQATLSASGALLAETGGFVQLEAHTQVLDGPVTADGAPSSVQFGEAEGIDPGSTVTLNGAVAAANGGQVAVRAESIVLNTTGVAEGFSSSLTLGDPWNATGGVVTIDGPLQASNGGSATAGANTINGNGNILVDGADSRATIVGEEVILNAPTLANEGALQLLTPAWGVPGPTTITFLGDVTVPGTCTLHVSDLFSSTGLALNFNLVNSGNSTFLFGASVNNLNGTVANDSSGTMEFSLASGQLNITGGVSNSGMTIVRQGTFDANGGLTNESTGTITGYEAVVDSILINHGLVSIYQESFTLRGAVQNPGTCRAGGGTDDATLIIDATIFVQTGEIVAGPNGVIDLHQPLNNQSVITVADGEITGQTLTNASGAAIAGWGEISCPLQNAGTLLVNPASVMLLSGSSVDNTGWIDLPVLSLLMFTTPAFTQTGQMDVGLDAVALFVDPLSNSGHIMLSGGAVSAQVTNNAAPGIEGFGEVDGDLANYGLVEFFGNSTIIGNVDNGDQNNHANAVLRMRNLSLLITGATTNYGTIETINGEIVFEGGLTNFGTLNFDPARMVMSGLSVGPDGVLRALDREPNEIILTGSFDNESDEVQSWDTRFTILQFNGGDGSASDLEVTSTDLGVSPTSFRTNFAWGTLHVGSSQTTVNLRDNRINGTSGQPEAAYVTQLELDPGTVLDLNGLNLYYRGTVTNNGGTTVNGAPIYVPTADIDLDDDVDLDDHAAFAQCLTGPAGGVPAGCETFDLDIDGDVDLTDFGTFQSIFAGS